MYSVSNDYLTALHSAVQNGYISGTVGGVAFTPDDVLLGSASISNKCADGSDITLGAVNIGVLKITFINKNLLPRGTWEGQEIVIYWNQLISQDPDTYEQVPCGVYIVKEANHSAEGVVITSYDRMSKLDKAVPFTTLSGSIYSIVKLIADDCGVTLGDTRTYIDGLPNGGETFSLYPDNDIKTYRDLLFWTAQTCGTFATFDRGGNLVLRQFGAAPVMTIGADERIKGGSFSDFKTFYTGLSVVDIANGETKYIHDFPDNGLTMNLGSNPFLQYGLVETLNRERHAILGALSDFNYTPFSTSMLGNPIFDLGDVITFTDGIAGTHSTCCVMSFNYIFNRVFNVSGFGKNPATLGAQSKTDKNISGLSRQNQSNETTYISYTNADPLEIRQGFKDNVGDIPANPVKILLATFNITTIRETNVEIDFKMSTWNFKPTINGQSNAFFYLVASFWGVVYELDGEEIGKTLNTSMSPMKEGDVRSNTYWIELFSNLMETQKRVQMTFEDHKTITKLPANSSKTLNIYGYFVDSFTRYDLTIPAPSSIVNGHYNFDAGSINIVVKGQGLAKQPTWDGYLQFADELVKVSIGYMETDDIQESVTVSLITPVIIDGLSDDIQEAEIDGVDIVDIDESLDIQFTRLTFNLVTEDGEYNIVTEDEDYNLITE